MSLPNSPNLRFWNEYWQVMGIADIIRLSENFGVNKKATILNLLKLYRSHVVRNGIEKLKSTEYYKEYLEIFNKLSILV